MNYDLSIAQDRRTAAQFAASNPTPSSGQLCIETDTGWAKTGDGTTAYRLLSPFRLSGEERQSADDVYAAMGLSDSRDGGYDPPFGEYVVLLNQTGTNAPVPTVLTNTLGFTPTWSYSTVGAYLLTSTGNFPEDKVAIMAIGAAGPLNGDIQFGAIVVGDGNTIAVGCLDTGSDADGVLVNTIFAFRLYP